MSDSQRIEVLEGAVRALFREVQMLRAEVRQFSGVPAAAPPHAETLESRPPLSDAPPAALRPPPLAQPVARAAPASRRLGVASRFAALDFESLVGRYGTMALAALTILMGVGAFLTWAVANVRLGPGLRVVLGALAAGVVGAVGWRLRSSTSRRYGNTLLALALAIVHLDAWAAGPHLHVIDPWAALSVAAVASLALAALALAAGEESLFAVGTGGALVAPFVTSDERGSVVVLLTYGLVVLSAGLVAMRGRAWTLSALLLAAGVWVYAIAGLGLVSEHSAWWPGDAPALFALAFAWLALLVAGPRQRAPLALAALGAASAALAGGVASALGNGGAAHGRGFDIVALAVLATITSYGALARATTPTLRERVAGAVVLPLVLFTTALSALDDPLTIRGAALAALWTAVALVAAWTSGREQRGPHLMVAGLVSATIPVLALRHRDLDIVLLLAAHASALSLLLRRERTRLLWVPIALVLIGITVQSFDMLSMRAAYQYTPFFTRASLAAAAVCAAWWMASWHGARTIFLDGTPLTDDQRSLIRTLGAVATFFWVREEMGRAFSADVAVFFLIFYYAAAGVAAIWLGRLRALPIARRAGLAIAVYAALKAVVQASALGTVTLKVGSYLLVGCFLLAVAYWYRAAGDAEPPAMEPTAG